MSATHLNRHIPWGTLVILGLLHPFTLCQLAAAPLETPATSRPNILFIAIDDLRPSLGCYGDELAKSPNLDRFARTARQFNHAYVQQAVCGPSRTSLLTGLLPDHTKVWHNRNRFRDTLPEHVTLPQCFKQQGYNTVSLGKIFSSKTAECDPLSWSEPEVVQHPDWGRYLLPENQGSSLKYAPFEAPEVEDNAYADGQLADLAIETMERLQSQEQPFFLALGFFKPHLPFNAPRRYWDLYEETSFALSQKAQPSSGELAEFSRHSHRELGGYRGIPKNEELSLAQTRQLRQGYYACVSYIDAQVGKVLDSLERLQLDERTIVVVWGDHGFALGEGNRWCKGTNFELDTRIPLLIRTPQLPFPGTSTNALVETVDLYPTLADLAGLTTPPNLDGQSFQSVITDPRAKGRDVVLSQFNRPWKATRPEVMGYSIRTPTTRYTRWLDTESHQIRFEELYDYTSDEAIATFGPHRVERENLTQTQPARLEEMRRILDRILRNRLRGEP